MKFLSAFIIALLLGAVLSSPVTPDAENKKTEKRGIYGGFGHYGPGYYGGFGHGYGHGFGYPHYGHGHGFYSHGYGHGHGHGYSHSHGFGYGGYPHFH